MNIPPHHRPVHLLQGGHWKRIEAETALKKERTVQMGRFFYVCDDLSDLVGVPAYAWAPSEDEIYVFDFSASHLCPNQLERIRLAYANVSKRSPHHG